MPDRPPFPGRPAQPPGLTHLDYSPDGQRLTVAGCGNFARSFRTNHHGEPDMLMDTHEDTYAVATGVRLLATLGDEAADMDRMTTRSLAAKMVLSANTTCLTENSTRC